MNLSNETKIGLTVLLAVIVAYAGFRYMSDAPIFRQSNEIISNFDRVDGLSSGSVIYMNGVKIGSVRRISLQPDNTVQVVMAIELDVQIPKGSIAHLTSIGLIDGKAIVIERGDSNEYVTYGGEIEGRYEDTMMETLAEKGQELGDNISDSFTELNRFLFQLNETLDEDSKNNFGESLRHVESVTRSLSEVLESRQQDLNQTLSSANRVMSQLDTLATDSRPRVDSLLTNLDQTIQELNKRSMELDQTLDQLNRILTKINDGEGTLGLLVNDPSLYHNTDSLSVEIKELLRNFNDNPRRFLRHMKLIEIF
ncbi:MAG: MlaD family protein [Balneolaceae bacterium]